MPKTENSKKQQYKHIIERGEMKEIPSVFQYLCFQAVGNQEGERGGRGKIHMEGSRQRGTTVSQVLQKAAIFMHSMGLMTIETKIFLKLDSKYWIVINKEDGRKSISEGN